MNSASHREYTTGNQIGEEVLLMPRQNSGADHVCAWGPGQHCESKNAEGDDCAREEPAPSRVKSGKIHRIHPRRRILQVSRAM